MNWERILIYDKRVMGTVKMATASEHTSRVKSGSSLFDYSKARVSKLQQDMCRQITHVCLPAHAAVTLWTHLI